MRIPLDPGDLKFLILAGVLLGLVTAATLVLAPPPQSPSLGYPSSYSAASDGAKAAYLLLGKLDYKVQRWERPPADLPSQPENTLLILADPIIPAPAEERAQI